MNTSWKNDLYAEYPELFELVDDSSTPLFFDFVFREFGVHRYNVVDGSKLESYDVISFCPITGKKLPKSLRDLFFDEIEALGFTSSQDEGLPAKYKNADWWTERLGMTPDRST